MSAWQHLYVKAARLKNRTIHLADRCGNPATQNTIGSDERGYGGDIPGWPLIKLNGVDVYAGIRAGR